MTIESASARVPVERRLVRLSSTFRSAALVALAAAGVALVSDVPASARSGATDPIVGAWEFRTPSDFAAGWAAFGFEIRVRATSPGVFVGTVARVGASTGCALPVGLDVWKLKRAGPAGSISQSYSGTVQDFYFGRPGDCKLEPRKSVWTLWFHRNSTGKVEGWTVDMCIGGETLFSGDVGDACVGYAKIAQANKDITPPSVRALPGTGEYGGKGQLRAYVSDDSGWAKAHIKLYDGAQLIGWTDDKAFRKYVKGHQYVLEMTWPFASDGPLRFCVQVEDKAGNKAQSCALITLR